MYAREHDFDDEIAEASSETGVPEWVIRTTIGTESSFNPAAFNGSDPGSGSRGLMQLELATARGLGYDGEPGNDATKSGGLYSPSENIRLGALLLAQLRDRYPAARWDQVYGAYNAGAIRRRTDGSLVNQSNVDRWGRIADYFNPTWRVEGAGSLLPPGEESPPELDPHKPRGE